MKTFIGIVLICINCCMLIDAMPAAPKPKVSSTFSFNSSPSMGYRRTATQPNAMPRHTHHETLSQIQTTTRTNVIPSQMAAGVKDVSTENLANNTDTKPKKPFPYVLAIIDPVFGNKPVQTSNDQVTVNASNKLPATVATPKVSVPQKSPNGNSANNEQPVVPPPNTGKVLVVIVCI